MRMAVRLRVVMGRGHPFVMPGTLTDSRPEYNCYEEKWVDNRTA
jgi:hypothetical protein